MWFIRFVVSFCAFLSIWFASETNADKPCAARAIAGQSVVCVCDETYCDETTRDLPNHDQYVAYTSSKSGDRFSKTRAKLESVQSSTCCSTTLELNPGTKYQTIEGFGGAVTDAAGINWKNLSEALQYQLIKTYFGSTGSQYNMLRVPIGGSDFSTHAYAYNELPVNDTKLTNYSLSIEDYEYKIPMIEAIKKVANCDVNIVATTWSPPVWMKTNNEFYGSSRLRPEYYQTYADYHFKFLQSYAAKGIKIWAITATNEPVNGVIPIARFNSLGWNPKDMGEWIVDNLGPTIRNSSFKDVKILAVDDQRYTIPVWFDVMIYKQPKALEYIDGVAVHFYGDSFTPASILSHVPKAYPGIFVIATEACEGSFPWQPNKVLLGSWQRAESYIWDILQDLNHGVVGWIDWNLCLNKQGGPNWAGNFVDSPIIVFPEKGEFIKQPMFYALGHVSKFVPRGSQRIEVTETKPLLAASVQNVAFLTPNNTIVAVLYNSVNEARVVAVRLGDKQANLQMKPNSITTLEFPLL